MLPLLILNVLLYCAHLSEASNVTVSKNVTLAGSHASVKQLGDQVFDAGLTVLNATYPRVPPLNQVLPELPPKVANSSIGLRAKAAVDAASVCSLLLFWTEPNRASPQNTFVHLDVVTKYRGSCRSCRTSGGFCR